jgi:hypothetical protein
LRATALQAGSEHPQAVREQLGRASISETHDRYSHDSADMHRAAVQRGVLFGKPVGQPTPDPESFSRCSATMRLNRVYRGQ